MFCVAVWAEGRNRTTTSRHTVFVTPIGGIICPRKCSGYSNIGVWARKQMESNSEFGRRMTNLLFLKLKCTARGGKRPTSQCHWKSCRDTRNNHRYGVPGADHRLGSLLATCRGLLPPVLHPNPLKSDRLPAIAPNRRLEIPSNRL
jgi:hypothetical protein